jgi:pyridoxamine 5'-phosphate oxidase family protein
MTVFTERELAFLSEQLLGRLATVRRDGTVQNNPVTFGFNTALQTIDIDGHGMETSQKFRNVAAGSSVSLVVDDVASVNPWSVRCLEIRGSAEALPEATNAAGEPTGALIRIHPRRVLSFNIDPDAGIRSVAD